MVDGVMEFRADKDPPSSSLGGLGKSFDFSPLKFLRVFQCYIAMIDFCGWSVDQ